MQLTTDQINTIKSFISKKGVEYLDVQMEILDHVASAFEDKRIENPNLSFEDSLKQIHASFGVFGFSTIEDSITKSMEKRFRKVFLKTFISFFGLKYCAFTLLSGVVVYKIQEMLKVDYYLFTMSLISTVAVTSILIVFGLNFRKYRKFFAYRASSLYLMFMGSFIILINTVIKQTPIMELFGAKSEHIFSSILLVLFTLYIISAIKTAKIGIKESELLMDKYKLAF